MCGAGELGGKGDGEEGTSIFSSFMLHHIMMLIKNLTKMFRKFIHDKNQMEIPLSNFLLRNLIFIFMKQVLCFS